MQQRNSEQRTMLLTLKNALLIKCDYVFNVVSFVNARRKKTNSRNSVGRLDAVDIHFNWCRKFSSLLISKIKATFRSLSLAYCDLLCSQYENDVRLVVSFCLGSFCVFSFHFFRSIFRQSLSPFLHWHAWRLHIYSKLVVGVTCQSME